jgi:hypothetical protein
VSKLPSNLVKPPPAFDNPLRPTVPTEKPAKHQPKAVAVEHSPETKTKADSRVEELEVAGAAKAQEPALAAATAPSETSPQSNEGGAQEEYRVTARFNDEQWRALQTECHERRMKGKRMNVAELLRQIVDEWRARVDK